jgi:hypothetical protein
VTPLIQREDLISLAHRLERPDQGLGCCPTQARIFSPQHQYSGSVPLALSGTAACPRSCRNSEAIQYWHHRRQAPRLAMCAWLTMNEVITARYCSSFHSMVSWSPVSLAVAVAVWGSRVFPLGGLRWDFAGAGGAMHAFIRMDRAERTRADEVASDCTPISIFRAFFSMAFFLRFEAVS